MEENDALALKHLAGHVSTLVMLSPLALRTTLEMVGPKELVRLQIAVNKEIRRRNESGGFELQESYKDERLVC